MSNKVKDRAHWKKEEEKLTASKDAPEPQEEAESKVDDDP